jgi:hypothetical protein
MNKIKENTFEAPGVGSLNYGQQYGTPNYAYQNPDTFDSSTLNQSSNTSKDTPKSRADTEKTVDAIYAKKDTPTPDEIVCGIKYELGQQIKKDKREAKQLVLAHLKKNPHFYSELKMLNIDDESMVDNMTETKQHPNDAPARPKVTVNLEETRRIFTEMAKGKDQKYVVNSQIVDVMKEMWEAKRKRMEWKLGKNER